MPRRNRNAEGRDFESMSGSKIKALLEQLQWEWKERHGGESQRPADRERW